MKKLLLITSATCLLIGFNPFGASYPAFGQYNNLHNFNLTDGLAPNGDLISDGTFLYGVTNGGGTNSLGTIFKIKPDGTGFANVLNFVGAVNGSYPKGSLIYDGTFLYGMTAYGGTSDMGTVFKIKPDGTGYAKLLDFAGSVNGRTPQGALISDGTFLYGMTWRGGVNDTGVVFKIKPDGTGFVKLLDFTGANGSNPYGSLISDGTFLYGMTSGGGTFSSGTIFKIKPDGTGFAKLLDFTITGTNGNTPYASFITDGTFLYGMTHDGGTNGYGTVFKIKPDGTGFVKLLDFTGANGAAPYIGCNLISDGTFLYGMTTEGGPAMRGNIFKIKPDGTGYVNLLDFTGNANGGYPYGSLISDATFLYGITFDGGTNNFGTVFKYNKVCIPVTFTWSPTVCAGDSVTVGSNTYTVSGTYTDIFPLAVNGCDSTVTTNLTVLPANTFTQSPTVCAGQSITVGSNTYTVSGSYIDTLTAVNTCDSIVTTNLTVFPNTYTQSPTVCAGQSVTVGSNTYTVSGTYTDTLTATNTCDSIVTTNLTVLTAITNSVTIVSPACGNNNGSAAVLPSGGAGIYTFLWSNGNTTSAVTGLTGLPTDTLIVTITDSIGCTLTDTAIVNCVTGISQWSMVNYPLSISPNPFHTQTILHTNKVFKDATLTVYNSFGQTVKQINNLSIQTITLHRDNLPSGLYFVRITQDNVVIASDKLVIVDN